MSTFPIPKVPPTPEQRAEAWRLLRMYAECEVSAPLFPPAMEMLFPAGTEVNVPALSPYESRHGRAKVVRWVLSGRIQVETETGWERMLSLSELLELNPEPPPAHTPGAAA